RTGRQNGGGPRSGCARCERSKGTQGRKLVDQMIKEGRIKIEGDKKYKAAVKQNLYKVANTKTGRDSLGTIRKAGFPVTIKPRERDMRCDACGPKHTGDFPAGEHTDLKTGQKVVGTGRGSPSTVYHDPDQPTSSSSTPDSALNHELGHAAHNSTGTNERHTPARDQAGAPNREEEKTTENEDNGYRRERGLPEREKYNDPL